MRREMVAGALVLSTMAIAGARTADTPPSRADRPPAARADQDARRWAMDETAMTADGRLTFLDKPWWPKAKALAEGERFTLDLNRDGRPDTLITRQNGHIVEAIDDTGHAADIWNRVSTAYLVSFNGTGLVDRLIAYIDNDDDGRADEMDLRHYQDGYLRYAWFGENYDDDGAQIFDLRDWSYPGENGVNKFRGNLQIYLNKYDPATRGWVPLSECPFAFWDDDRDGHGDTVLRVSAAPRNTLTGPDTDYANNYKYMWAPEATPLRDMANLNVRLSFNLDPAPRREPVSKPHYTFGFTMVGLQPYAYDGMPYTNPRRRAPQTVQRIAWKDGLGVGLRYPARETGFTWDESRSVWHWEGQFWIYERRYLSNTGGPTTRWNMRREYSAKPSATRDLYYAEADRRYHLFGASEGWLEAGHLVNDQKDLEWRWFDRDEDGYLDEVQVFVGAATAPARVTRFAPRARRVALDRVALVREYNERVLPDAIAENRRLLDVLRPLASVPVAEAYEAAAAAADSLERTRYCLDVARELRFLAVRDLLRARADGGPYPSTLVDKKKIRSMEPGTADAGYSMGDSLRFWEQARTIDAFVRSYEEGRYGDAAAALDAIRR